MGNSLGLYIWKNIKNIDRVHPSSSQKFGVNNDICSKDLQVCKLNNIKIAPEPDDSDKKTFDDHECSKCCTISDETRPVSVCNTTLVVVRTSLPCEVEKVLDSEYIKQWLPQDDATLMLNSLMLLGESRLSQLKYENPNKKYPLLSLYFGLSRKKDGARALDRWGSDYESWLRVEKPPDIVVKCIERLRINWNMHEESLNSVLVNFYFDGNSMYIPAHRDTVTSLEDESAIYCLSLGATRDFILCDNDDFGKFERQDLHIKHEWAVGHGDLFVLGQKTNTTFCHVVPRDEKVKSPRISLIFRSVSKSFIDLNTEAKSVLYANGTLKSFNASCIVTKDYNDEGHHEHIADLINEREKKKLLYKQQKNVQDLEDKGLKNYYMGNGNTTLLIA